MGIQWEKGGRRRAALIIAVAAALAQLAAGFWKGLSLPVNAAIALGLAAAAFFAFGTRVRLRRWWGALIALLPFAAASALIVHLPIMEWMGPITEQYGRYVGTWYWWVHFLPQGWLKSVLLALAVLCVLYALTASVKWSCLIWIGFCWIFGLIDAEIYEFSGNVITLSDITAIGTAMNVAENYRPVVTPMMITQLILTAACAAALIRCREDRLPLKKLAARIGALAMIVPCAVYLRGAVLHGRSSTFGFNGVRRNGVFTSFLVELRTLNIKPPKGYSAEAVAALGEEYPAQAAVVSGEKRPHVIAIMVEAFSDLSVLGDGLKTDVDYMPFTRELMKQSVSGNALVSTYGGGTARSEWEFLTGNSMCFLPAGSMPFRQFMGSDENSIVRVFRNAGYHTIGMHPFYGNGWGRNRAYPALGFEETIFLEDSDWDDYVRSFVSDRGFVHKVIQLYEDRSPDQPMFFFGVTMQNHSNYFDADYETTVHLEGMKDSYSYIEQYLSLIRESDEAIRELIEYFSAVDEPVVIVFFGDHQPKASWAFYREAGLKYSMMRYVVPFVMWDNYEHRTEDVELTSLNYLPARLLDLAGIRKPSWYCFLSELSRHIPAVNNAGFYTGKKFVNYDDEKPDIADEDRAWMGKYQIYQYANMFDKSADRALFVGEEAQ